jgi:hypothetical protein
MIGRFAPINRVIQTFLWPGLVHQTDHIINVGMWDDTMTAGGKQMTARVRTTELLHRSNSKWRYMIDNASIGLPPSPAKPC